MEDIIKFISDNVCMEKNSLSDLKTSHTPKAIRDRLRKGPDHNYLKDFIYGSIDGTVTTFAIVSGVVGADLSNKVILILGFANLLADGFSMAVSNYLGTKAEEELKEKARKEENLHINIFPEGEKEEIRQIFSQKGFEGKQLEDAVKTITSDINRWIDTMLVEELGYSLNRQSALKAGLVTFFAFFFIGMIPILSYVINLFIPELIKNPFLVSIYLTGFTFLLIGALKSRYIIKPWYFSAIETLLVGSMAAAIAYIAAAGLKNLI